MNIAERFQRGVRAGGYDWRAGAPLEERKCEAEGELRLGYLQVRLEPGDPGDGA